MSAEKLKAAIRDIPDFPKPGIIFKDITPILSDPALFKMAIDLFTERHRGKEIDKIAAIDARSHEIAVRAELSFAFITGPLDAASAAPGAGIPGADGFTPAARGAGHTPGARAPTPHGPGGPGAITPLPP